MDVSTLDAWGPSKRLDRLFFELACQGVVVGVALDRVGFKCRLVTLDEDGVYWFLRAGTAPELVRWSLFFHARVYPSLETLTRAVVAGQVVGLLAQLAGLVGTVMGLEGDRPYLLVDDELPRPRPRAWPGIVPFAAVDGTPHGLPEPPGYRDRQALRDSWQALVDAGLASGVFSDDDDA